MLQRGQSVSALGDNGIRKALEAGEVIIYPFNEERLNNASYDVSLGSFVWAPVPTVAAIDPSMADPRDHYSLIDMEKRGPVTIPPHGFVLAHTQEFIGGTFDKQDGDGYLGKDDGVLGEIKTKSSAARWALDICRAAGWGDVGFFNRWTVEIQNAAPWPIIIKPGMLLGQIVFRPITDVDPENGYEVKGSYQLSSELDQVVDGWSPDMMLPKRLKVV